MAYNIGVPIFSPNRRCDVATITVNGNRIEVPDGASVSVSNGNIIVNSRTVASGLSGDVHVIWEGPVGSLNCQSCTINGNVAGDVDTQSIKCGNVGGNIDAQSVHCGDVKGRIDAQVVNRR